MHAKLSNGVVRWIEKQGWDALNAIQLKALHILHDLEYDAVIAAPTAGGKTEAAFLGIFSYLEVNPSALCIYVSPLKALINDQAKRLITIGKETGVPVHAWHGDVSYEEKQKFKKTHSGILIITPESLEAFLQVNSETATNFEHLVFTVIDEVHSFQEDPRGRQVQAILARLEYAIQRRTVRVGLSATIGSIDAIKRFVRPEAPENVFIIEELAANPPKLEARTIKSLRFETTDAIGLLAENFKDKKAIIFANSRNMVERIAFELDQVPGFMGKVGAHHGMLPKSSRGTVEKCLKATNSAYTAISTSTFEMGLDVGSVELVGQIGTPNSVASIKQRAGRSGRQNGRPHLVSILHAGFGGAHAGWLAELNLRWVEDIAKISLLSKGIIEAPYTHQYHGSTLLHQLLAFLRQVGEVDVIDVYSTLLVRGGFETISKDCFVELLGVLNEEQLLNLKGVHLALGARGKNLIQEAGFATAFRATPASTFTHDGHEVGRLPIDVPVLQDDVLILSGQRWRVTDVKPGNYEVAPDASEDPAISIAGHGEMIVHDIVREEMRALLKSTERNPVLCANGEDVLEGARRAFMRLRLGERKIFADEGKIFYFPWRGDRYLYGVKVLLEALGRKVALGPGYACFDGGYLPELGERLIALQEEGSAEQSVAAFLGNPEPNKYDSILPREFIGKDVVSRYFPETHLATILADIGREINRLV